MKKPEPWEVGFALGVRDAHDNADNGTPDEDLGRLTDEEIDFSDSIEDGMFGNCRDAALSMRGAGSGWRTYFQADAEGRRDLLAQAAKTLTALDYCLVCGDYKPCACRDCMELAIGRGRPLCHACVEAGCDPAAECSVAPDEDESEE